MNRRKFLKSGIALGTALAAGGIYAWKIEPYWLEFVHLPMPVKNLPKEHVGKTLIQLSDIHVGDRVPADYLIESMRKAQALNPDWVVYTGDFTHFKNSEQYSQLSTVLQSATKGKIGTFASLGNHDYGHAWSMPEVADETTSILENAGIKTLRDQKYNSEGLTIYGVEDLWGTNFNPEKVMKTWDPKEAALVMCHNPDACDLPVWNGYDGWVLAGHTHGGQVRPPFLPPPILPVKNRRYDQGKIDLEDGRTLYINRALGNYFPIRLNVRPEITVFTLTQALVQFSI
ncbi:metallophosphoesterase [Algoriphagus sp. NF]|uniref:metallophosphoesterase n=1 Tax=Algoriphagus sp. NF TaxID=2992756 RepID=UPI00237A2D42|nr:metallophosphoesterase [Algoriphagus sp. NF]MDE0559036.1 metallophosphoesterase [Algoriphagus sp. NF]